jgi:hypothetical protein
MGPPKTVAVMQPYFAPYAGYYRLLAAADLFVIYDCVQFPRRGWVHRNRLPNDAGEPEWLTLPLAHAPFDARIDSLVFAEDAETQMAERMRRFPSLAAPRSAALEFLHPAPFAGRFVDYAARQLETAAALFGFDCTFVRSSELGIDPDLRAQDRILAILDRVGARAYVNAPGGRALYDEAAFAARGISLGFLPDHVGPSWSLLHRLAVEDTADLAAEIRASAFAA